MKKYYYFIVEGVHDTSAIWRFIKLMNLNRVLNSDEVDDFWDRTIPKNFPHNKELRKRVPVPTFFHNEEISIAIQSAGGDGELIRSMNSITNIDYTELSGIALFCDADQKMANQRFDEIYQKLMSEILDEELMEIIKDTQLENVKKGKTNFGMYIFPDNENGGTLEDLLIEGAEISYKELLDLAKVYVDDAKNIDARYIKDARWSISSEKKVLVGVMANILKPGKANQMSIEDNKWISEFTIPETKQQKVQSFIQELISL
ncbi:hypothetical protein G159_02080 [Planococcus glaciei CHR43]|uniref:DUF3226 domain-containing protein n=1 Tax=Planococcus glaciei TaxID=459472 RepID=UPI0003DF1E8F|nr:DUF3226 domain-containing protein [Planococcus glaciei]ETP70339.1 hypothetical protein G159_02080 [Planococcus glaciei CHR43]